MDPRDQRAECLLFMHLFILGSSFTLSEFIPFVFTITPIWATLFLVPTAFHSVQRPSSFGCFLSLKHNVSRTSLSDEQPSLSSRCIDTCACPVEKQCYQAGAFLSLLLLCARCQARLPFVPIAPLKGLRDWSPSSLLRCCLTIPELATITSPCKMQVSPLSVLWLLISWSITYTFWFLQ